MKIIQTRHLFIILIFTAFIPSGFLFSEDTDRDVSSKMKKIT